MTTSKLEVIAPANEPVIITHRFIKASPALLFKLWTTPEHMKQWLGPRGLEMTSCEVDLRVGGSYRYVHSAPDGKEYGFHGKYLEIDAPHRMVCTFVFELFPQNEAVDTLTREEREGGTLVTTHTRHPSIEARDGHLAGGMERGMSEGYERLEALLDLMSGKAGNARIDTPKIVTTKEQLTAMVHLTVLRSEIQNVMGPGLSEVNAALAAQGIKPMGPWLTHHLKMDPKVFDFEICVPTATAVTPSGRVKPGRRPAQKVVRTVYHGSYEGLGAAWGELGQWIEARKLTPAPDLWEVYLAGPETGEDSASYRTELNQPLEE